MAFIGKHIEGFLDVLYPPHCLACSRIVASTGGLCGACRAETTFLDGLTCDSCAVPLLGDPQDGPAHCDACLADPPPWDRGRAELLYDGAGRRMVLALKNRGTPELGRSMGAWLAGVARDLVEPSTLIAPVPLHWMRRMQRGYNQSDYLARGVAKALDLPCRPDLLIRPHHTQKMEDMNRETRRANLEAAIVANPKRATSMAGRHVLIVDDVMTTGATLRAASLACLAGGAKRVSVAVMARVAKTT